MFYRMQIISRNEINIGLGKKFRRIFLFKIVYTISSSKMNEI